MHRALGANQQDLARAAGVSVSTVSRALSNSPGISAEVRAQIFDLAETLGYRQRGTAKVRPQVRAYVTSHVMSGGLVAFYRPSSPAWKRPPKVPASISTFASCSSASASMPAG